ncbi:MAG: c-type cytochrome [Candidimonas sp.]|nr:MAG: c-type cytochrome [Candidimonas sp.]
MKRVFSKALLAGGMLLGLSVASVGVMSTSFAADTGVAKPDAAKGEQLFTHGDPARGIVACITCHGAAGNSTIAANPNLAAQSHEYLAQQLETFRSQDGKPPLRRGKGGVNTVMTTFAQGLTAADIQNVAYYLAQQPLDWSKAGTATDKATVALGESIWRGGIPDRRVPACASCHSANGAGLPGKFPRLAGQHPGYLAEQLALFANGDRANSDMMHQIANRMTPADIAAVADYAAGLR